VSENVRPYDPAELKRLALELHEEQGLSLAKVAKELNDLGYRAQKGGLLQPAQIQRLIGTREERFDIPADIIDRDGDDVLTTKEIWTHASAAWHAIELLESIGPHAVPEGPYFVTTMEGGGWEGRGEDRQLDTGTPVTRACSAKEWWSSKLAERERAISTLRALAELHGKPFTFYDPVCPDSEVAQLSRLPSEIEARGEATRSIGNLGYSNQWEWANGVSALVKELTENTGWELHALLDRLQRPKSVKDDAGCRSQIRKLIFGLLREIALQREANLALRLADPELRRRLEVHMRTRAAARAKVEVTTEGGTKTGASGTAREGREEFRRGLDLQFSDGYERDGGADD